VGAFEGIFGATIARRCRRTVRLPGNGLAFLAGLAGDPVRFQATVAFVHALAVPGVTRERGRGENVGDNLVDGVV
jgi:hypothetical protein